MLSGIFLTLRRAQRPPCEAEQIEGQWQDQGGRSETGWRKDLTSKINAASGDVGLHLNKLLKTQRGK